MFTVQSESIYFIFFLSFMQKSRTIELSDYRNVPLNFQAFLLYDFDMFFVRWYSSRVIFVPHRVGTMRND